MKEISADGLKKLIDTGVIKNTRMGFIDPKLNQKIGYYRTKGAGGKRYIEDRYSNMAEKLR